MLIGNRDGECLVRHHVLLEGAHSDREFVSAFV